jgi:hypothetical protein
MEFIITGLFLSVIARLILNAIRDRRPQLTTITPECESICLYCIHAHIAHGYSAKQELTYCTYAGTAREVKFAVSDCSMFCHRNASSNIVRVIGFADTRADSQVLPAAARLNDY